MSKSVDPWDAEIADTHSDTKSLEELPTRFAYAYAELQAIAAALKPAPGKIVDVDELEPAIRRANLLGRFCSSRIEAVRALVEEQEQGLSDTL